MERQLFYDLINAELTDDYPALLERACVYLHKQIAENSKIVKYFAYSEAALDELVLQDYRATQEKYEQYVEENPPPRSRDNMITYLTQLTPAKYVDGAWVQGVAKACNTTLDGDNLYSKVVNYLFNIYAEELGEGVLEMNHIAIWKNLLANLGIEMPDPASHAFAFNTNLWDSSFVVANIQLALGTLSSTFFPEVLGYNMGFEQLPLHLLTTVDEMRKLSMDPYYFQLHISIDNLASGHGAMAVQAVKMYLDDVRTKFGDAVADAHWRRVLNGFYLNEVSPMKPELEKFYSAKRERNLEEEMVQMFRKKTPFASKLHGTREIAGCLLNKWLDPAASDQQLREFLEKLSTSHWIDSERPENSKFLTDLCGFGGPMFHIFTREELLLISDWIQSLCPTTPISPPPRANNPTNNKLVQPPVSVSQDHAQVAQAVAEIMAKKAERAKRAHGNRTMGNSKGESKKINDWLSADSVWELLDALRHTYRLDKVSSVKGTQTESAIDSNPFVKSIAQGGMSRYFDKEEVDLVRKWIRLGAPIPSFSATLNITPSISSPPNTLSSVSTTSNISKCPFSAPTSAPTSAPIVIDSPTPPSHTVIDSPTPPSHTVIDSPTPSPHTIIDSLTPPPHNNKSHTLPLSPVNNSSCPCSGTPPADPSDSNDSLASLFFRLVNVDANPKAFDEAKHFLSSYFRSDISYEGNIDLQSEECLQSLSSLIFSCDSLPNLTMIAKHMAPFFFVEGVCLQNVNMSGFHHTYTNSILMKIFMNIWGYEQPLANHHHFYNNLLKLLRVYLPPLNSTFISKCEFTDSAAEFAILQLSISLFPRTYFLELLAILEWSLVMNEMVLGDLDSKIKMLGACSAEPKVMQARIGEYTSSLQLCREVIQMHLDEARGQGMLPQYKSRLGNARRVCMQFTSQFVLQLSSLLDGKKDSKEVKEVKGVKEGNEVEEFKVVGKKELKLDQKQREFENAKQLGLPVLPVSIGSGSA